MIAERILGVRTALLIGIATTFVGFRLEVLNTTSNAEFASFIAAFAAIGIGIAILYRALASVIFGSLPREDLVMGLLVYKMSGVLGGSIAGALLGTILDHSIARYQSALRAGVNLASPAVNAFVQHSQGSPTFLAHLVMTQATTLAYSDLWSLASIAILVLIPCIFLIDIRTQN